MKRGIPPHLVNSFAVSLTAALMLFLAQCALVIALTAQVVLDKLNVTHLDKGLLGWTVLALAVNSFALIRAVKARHFLGLFSLWPGLEEEDHSLNETRLLAASAQQAFFHGDYAKARAFVERLGPPHEMGSLAIGRSLALDGRFEEALIALEKGGQGGSARRYLSQRRRWFFWKRSYFSRTDITWAHGSGRLAALGLAALLASCGALGMNYQFIEGAVAPIVAGFSEADFKVSVQGPFTIHYHDEAFMQETADIAREALADSLKFLDLPADSFAPGQIGLFLCADQREYLSRSPFTRAWEAASAVPSKHQIYFYKLAEKEQIFFEVVVAHELTHLCYHRIVPSNADDGWLNEGFADYMGYKFGLERNIDKTHYAPKAWLMEKHFASLKKKALPFENFLTESPRDMKDTERISTFYVQGFSIVYVLIEQYGRDDFLHFLRVFGAGKPLAQALATAYPTIRDAPALQAVWELFMR